MKRLAYLIVLGMLIAGCGGGDDGGGPSTENTDTQAESTNTPPEISDFIISTTAENVVLSAPLHGFAVKIGAGGGAITVSGSFEFTDVEGDVDRLLMEVETSKITGPDDDLKLTSTLESIVMDVSDQSLGKTSGTIKFQHIIDTSNSGFVVFTVLVMDSKGNTPTDEALLAAVTMREVL